MPNPPFFYQNRAIPHEEPFKAEFWEGGRKNDYADVLPPLLIQGSEDMISSTVKSCIARPSLAIVTAVVASECNISEQYQ